MIALWCEKEPIRPDDMVNMLIRLYYGMKKNRLDQIIWS